MERRDRPIVVRAVRGVSQMRRRREVEWLALYLGCAWIMYEVIALTVETFDLPALIVRGVAVSLAIGAVLAIPFAHWFELTARELDRVGDAELEDVPGVPDLLEPALARASRGVRPRTVVLAGAGSTLLFSGFFFVLWSAWASGHERVDPDPRISVVVFPFQATGPEASGYGEGVADLLIATLDGTPGLRVADPASIWRELRSDRGAPAREPDLDEAIELSRRASARRFVTGTVVVLGSRLDVSARVYDAANGERLASLKASANEDSLAAAVNRVAIDLVASVWERDQLPTVPEIERLATSNADALKAYLEAMHLTRRGQFREAEPIIERAISLDSTFALAHLAHFNIRSAILYQDAEPFIGIRPIIERAMLYRDKLTPRNRLRVEAFRAMDDTDGVRAAFLLERILSIDPLDNGALQSLAFTYLVNGWQIGKGRDEIIAAYDRAIAVDPASIRLRGARASLAILSDDPETAERLLEGLRDADTLSAFARGALGTFAALRAPDNEVDSILSALAEEPVPVVTSIVRSLRTARPQLAERYFDELAAETRPVRHRAIGSGARAQLWAAEGRLQAVDSLMQAGEFADIRSLMNLLFITAKLAGVGHDEITERAVVELSAYIPADSLLHYFNLRPAWPIGWSVGAYHASFGDTIEARVWQAAIGTLPGGGTPLDYRASLRSDIEARLAVRRGDLETAEREARSAYRNWGIHSGYFQNYHPEVAMRFHLAEVLRERGSTSEAEALYRSFTPPHSWYGFYTARAGLELGQIQEARGNRDEAVRYYLQAMRLWEHGEPQVVGTWLARAREGLRRLGGEPTDS